MPADRRARLVAIMRGDYWTGSGVTDVTDVTGVTANVTPRGNEGYGVTPVTPLSDETLQFEREIQEEKRARNRMSDPKDRQNVWWRELLDVRARYDEIAAVAEFEQGNSRDAAERIAIERLIETLRDYGLTENEALELVNTKLGLPFIVFR